MRLYQTKRSYVEAAQWFPGVKIRGVETWHGDRSRATYARVADGTRHRVSPGDWIVRNGAGDLAVYSAELFAELFEALPDETPARPADGG